MGQWLTGRRLAGSGALGYFLGVSIENQEVLTAPNLSSDVGEIRANYTDHAFGTVTATAGTLALIAFVVMAAALIAHLRERDPGSEPWTTIALLGGIASPVIAASGLAADAILVAGTGGLGEDLTRSLFHMQILTRMVAGPFLALFLIGVGVTALRSGALPRPLSWFALANAAVLLLTPIAAFDQERSLEVAVSVVYAANALWVFLLGMWLVLSEGAPSGATRFVSIGPIPFVRRAAFLLLAIAAGSIGLALVAAPRGTGQFFAWVLQPEPLAAFAGGVYIGSATAYALSMPYSARQVRGLVAGAVVLSVSVFIVTLAHTDQFDFSRLQAVMWLILFAVFSAVTIGLLALDRDDDERSGRVRSSDPLPVWLRTAFGTVAVLGWALALWLWIHPGGVSGPSPFLLPPLGGGFAGSWVALLATVCGWAAVRDRLDETRPAAFLLCFLPAGALVAGLRTIDQLDPAGAAVAYLLVLAGLAALGATGIARTGRTRSG
jgi:uncharacterized membrane protein YccF (DUF307 family)